MKILVTGGKGQLGSELADLLASTRTECWNPSPDELDVTREEAVRDAILGGSMGPVHAVIHCGAMTQVDLCETEPEAAHRVNGTATGYVARAAAEAGIPLVYLSTDFVFDGKRRTPYPEDAPTGPLSVYGASKLEGERQVLEHAPNSWIVRTAWVYGVYGQNFPRAILAAAAGEKPIRVVDDQIGAPTYARDLAEATLQLMGIRVPAEGLLHRSRSGRLGPGPYGIYHIVNSGSCSWYEFSRAVLRGAGWPVSVTPITTRELGRPAPRPAYSVLATTRAEGVGIRLRPWQQALPGFLALLRSRHPHLFAPDEAMV